MFTGWVNSAAISSRCSRIRKLGSLLGIAATGFDSFQRLSCSGHVHNPREWDCEPGDAVSRNGKSLHAKRCLVHCGAVYKSRNADTATLQ